MADKFIETSVDHVLPFRCKGSCFVDICNEERFLTVENVRESKKIKEKENHSMRVNKKQKPLSFSIEKILSEELQPKRDWRIQGSYIIKPYSLNRPSCFVGGSCKHCSMFDHGLPYIQSTNIHSYPHFDWLSCTRYNPPKITRAKRRNSSTERASSRQPRIPFTPYQQATLEKQFQSNQYLTTALLTTLAHALKLSKQRIKVWYQNRRARDRREELSKSSQ